MLDSRRKQKQHEISNLSSYFKAGQFVLFSNKGRSFGNPESIKFKVSTFFVFLYQPLINL